MRDEKQSYGILGLFGEVRDSIKTFGKLHTAITRGSMSENLKNTMVNPLTIVERSIAHNPNIDNILYACNDIYLAIYLAMASRLTAQGLDSARVTRVLEKLATDRDPLATLASGESTSALALVQLGCEARRGDDDDEVNRLSMSGRDQIDKIIPMDSLSVGKTVILTFTEGETELPVPINIRLNVNLASAELVRDIYLANFTDHNIINNIKSVYIYGEQTWLEAFTGMKYVKRQERLLMADVNGELRDHFGDAAKELGFSMLTGDIAINRASGIILTDKANKRQLERAFRGDLDKFRDRERLMEGTACMLLCVVDQEDDMCTFYLKGLKDKQVLKFTQIKVKSNGQSAIDINQIMGGAMVGSVPSLT